MTGVQMLVEAILNGKLGYYRETGSSAYVVRYEDGKQEIVYNAHKARHARPGMKFEIIATARWEDCLGNPRWTIYFDDQAVAAIATESDGTVTDPDVYYYPV